jgi:hypothetical protein
LRFRVLRRGNFTGDDETAIGSHDDATGVLGYVAQGRAMAVHRRVLSTPAAKPKGAVVSHQSDYQLTGGNFFYPARLSVSPQRESGRRQHESSRREVTGDEQAALAA